MPLGTFGVVAVLALAQGGYWPTTYGAATIALLLAIVATASRERHVELGRLDAAMLGGLAVLAAWTAASQAWSLDPDASVLEAERVLLYLCAATLLLLVGRRAARSGMLAAVLFACTSVCGLALVAWRRGAPAPLGYSEALGVAAAVGIILALGFAHAGRRLALVALGPLVATLWLAHSRAAIVALAIGVAVAVALARGRRAALVALALAITVGAVAASGHGAQSLRARVPLWQVAWRAAQAHPVIGTGAGSFGRLWLRQRTSPRTYRDAHDLYLGTLAELGIVGVGALLLALVTPLVAAVRARGERLVPAAAGAYSVYLVHVAAHWDWKIPAVTLAALVCGANVMLAARRPGADRAPPALARVSVVLAALALAVASTAGIAANAALRGSRQAVALGSLGDAAAEARVAARFAPWSAEPREILAHAALSGGDVHAARAELRQALSRDRSS